MSGKVIVIAQQKGGSGKTTLAANLAVALGGQGRSVTLIDSDPQGSLGRWFMARLDASHGAPGVEFATASAWGVAYECDKLRQSRDFVLVDTPPKIDADLRPALRAADLVLLPVSASLVDLWATEGVIALAEREERPVLLVLNRARAGTRLASEVLARMDALAVRRARTVIGQRVLYAETLGRGLSVVERRAGGPAAVEIGALAAEILALLAS